MRFARNGADAMGHVASVELLYGARQRLMSRDSRRRWQRITTGGDPAHLDMTGLSTFTLGLDVSHGYGDGLSARTHGGSVRGH